MRDGKTQGRFCCAYGRVNALEPENATLRSRGTVTVEDLDPVRDDIQRLTRAHERASWTETVKMVLKSMLLTTAL